MEVTFGIVSCAEKNIILTFSVRTCIMHERRCIRVYSYTFDELPKSTFSHTYISSQSFKCCVRAQFNIHFACIHSKYVVMTKSVLFQLNVGHKDAPVT